MRRAHALVGASLIAVAALAFACASQRASSLPSEALAIRASQVAVEPAELNRLRLRGGFALTADHRDFGGLSGLLVEDGRLTAVTDRGWLLEAPLVEGAQGVRPGPARFVPLRENGAALTGTSAVDAESLARAPGGVAVGFERDHRIAFLRGAELGDAITDRSFERLGNNQGLEALASLPDGRLLAIGEASRDGAFAAFVIDADGTVTVGRVALPGSLLVTGADTGPDGRLYLVRRDFSLLGGFTIAVERYRLSRSGLPRPETRELLADFPGRSGIDNMEGIAVWRDAAGRMRLTLISDDNFNPFQRTLLLDFEVTD